MPTYLGPLPVLSPGSWRTAGGSADPEALAAALSRGVTPEPPSGVSGTLGASLAAVTASLAGTYAEPVDYPPVAMPSGLTLVRTDDGSSSSNTWGGATANTTVSGAPWSPDKAIRFTYPAGSVGSEGGFSVGGVHNPVPGDTVSIGISVALRLSSNWTGHPAASKLIYWRRSNDSPSLMLQITGSGPTFSVFGEPQTSAGPATMFANVTGGTIARGEWVHIQALTVMNTGTSTSDGIFRCWINGTLTHDYSNVRYSESSQPLAWGEANIDPYYGGNEPSHSIPETQYLDVDHMVISSSTSRLS